jgi:hypothetical protein
MGFTAFTSRNDSPPRLYYAWVGFSVYGSNANEAQGNSRQFECTLAGLGAGVGGTIYAGQGTYGAEPVNTAEAGFFGPR